MAPRLVPSLVGRCRHGTLVDGGERRCPGDMILLIIYLIWFVRIDVARTKANEGNSPPCSWWWFVLYDAQSCMYVCKYMVHLAGLRGDRDRDRDCDRLSPYTVHCRVYECTVSTQTVYVHTLSYVEWIVYPRDIAYKLRHVNLSWTNPVPRVDDVSAIQPVQCGLRLRVWFEFCILLCVRLPWKLCGCGLQARGRGRTRSGGLTIIAKLSDVHEYLNQVRRTECMLYSLYCTDENATPTTEYLSRHNSCKWLGARLGQFAHDLIWPRAPVLWVDKRSSVVDRFEEERENEWGVHHCMVEDP